MLQSDSDAGLGAQSSSRATIKRRGRTRGEAAHHQRNSPQIQPLPRWAKGDAGAHDDPGDAQFFAGAGLALLDQILRSGADVSSAGKSGAEPAFAGCLRQRLALKAAASCARFARLREDAAALRDAEHLGGAGVETSPAGRLHRLWRHFAQRPVRIDAATLSIAAEHVGAPSAVDGERLAEALRQTVASANDPLAAAAGASAAAMHDLAAVPGVEAEILALWLADAALAQKLGWQAPVPLLATVILHPALRRAPNGRRPRPGDRDWSNALASAYALAAREAVDLAVDLSRRAEKLFDAAPKLRAKGAERVIEMLLADDCVGPARAAKYAKLSDRSSRRLFDRLVELGAVRELTGRSSFRLYGL
ncbi:MAG: hypothetical protein FD148_1390 [Methylocystaceae bacterium]|nr:MAG: hypothetical protein FD148_1390 [Methylocystaceae bacterium]